MANNGHWTGHAGFILGEHYRESAGGSTFSGYYSNLRNERAAHASARAARDRHSYDCRCVVCKPPTPGVMECRHCRAILDGSYRFIHNEHGSRGELCDRYFYARQGIREHILLDWKNRMQQDLDPLLLEFFLLETSLIVKEYYEHIVQTIIEDKPTNLGQMFSELKPLIQFLWRNYLSVASVVFVPGDVYAHMQPKRY